MDTDELTCQAYIKELKKEFHSLPVEDVAFPRGISNLDGWMAKKINAYDK